MKNKELTEEERKFLMEEDPETRRTLLTFLAQERKNIEDFLKDILNSEKNPIDQGFKKIISNDKEIFTYALKDLRLNKNNYHFLKTPEGYEKI